MSGQLPALNARQVIAALRGAGFSLDRSSGSHQILKHANGRVVTVPFHGARSLKSGTLRGLMRQAGLSLDEFRALL